MKFGRDVTVTPKFKLGADVLVAGAQYFFADDANQNPKLPLYWAANLHASYQMDEHVQLFGLINNIFDNRNATYGAFFNTGTGAQLASPIPFTSDPRNLTPLQPISFYGGVKVTSVVPQFDFSRAWRRDIVPVGLRERGFEALVYDCVFVST